MSWCRWLTGTKLHECRESREHALLAAPLLMEDARSECTYGWTSRFHIDRIDGNGWNLRDGDKFLIADINGDGREELVVVSPDGQWIGVLSEQGGSLVSSWIGHDWVNPPGGSGPSGWNLRNGDKFLVADINGDGREEIVVVSPDGQWIGVLSEQGGSLVSAWIGHDWVNPPGGSGPSGWNLRGGDTFKIADINGDGRDEIVVVSPDGQWIGVLSEQGGGLVSSWIGHDWVNPPGGSGPSGWNLRSGDKFLIVDINGDRRDEIVVVSPDGQWIGVLSEQGGSLVSSWIGHDWVNPPGGSGPSGWNLRGGDTFKIADINGDGRDEIVVVSPDGQWIGVLSEQGGGLVSSWIGHDWVNPPGGFGATGWNLRSGDRFYIADINGDGREEIAVVSPDGQWIGVLSELGRGLVSAWIGHDWVNPPGGSGSSGWNLRSGDKLLIADVNGDSRDEILVVSPDGQWIGVLSELGGVLVAGGIEHDWVYDGAARGRGSLRIVLRIRLDFDAAIPQDARAAAQARWQGRIDSVWSNCFLFTRSFGDCVPYEYEVHVECKFVDEDEDHVVRIHNVGWNLRDGDRFNIADINGDGLQEIVIVSPDGQWIGVLDGQGGSLVAGWIGHDWVNPPGGSGPSGWNLRDGDKVLIADINGDGREELVVVSPDGQWIGVLSEQGGSLVSSWIGHDWVNPPGGSGPSGWNLRNGDKLLVADINGDGREEIVVVSPDGQWIGVLSEQGGSLVSSRIGHDWVNPPGGSGPSGWNLRNGDKFLVADINGDGREEIVVVSPDGQWIGVLSEQGGSLVSAWIGHDWVNPPGGSGQSGWNLRSGDKFLIADVNGDSREEIVVVSPDGQWIGVLSEQGGGLVSSWIGHDWVNPPGGSGPSGWNLRSGDKFLIADINGDGREEVLAVSPDGQWIGVLSEQGGSLVSSWIGHDWVNPPGGSGPSGWNLRGGDTFNMADINGDGRDEILVVSPDGQWIGVLSEQGGGLVSSWIGHDWVTGLAGGRENMANWYITTSGGTAAHEAGHMLGFPDEYADTACPNRVVTNDSSIMQDNAGAPQQRHYELFLLWLCHRANCGFHFA